MVSLFGKQKDEREGASGVPPAAPAAASSRAATETERPSRGGGFHAKGEAEMATIGKSIAIKGDLTGKEDLVIEGMVEGRVELPEAQLTVGANGTIKAEIQAKSVVVIGKVTGNIHGTDRIEIQSTGAVKGDVMAPRLVVAEGAQLNGAIQMTGTEGVSATRTPASSGSAPSGEARKAG
jgi:cytoskeletal protein CcmA (bactofilin family)